MSLLLISSSQELEMQMFSHSPADANSTTQTFMWHTEVFTPPQHALKHIIVYLLCVCLRRFIKHVSNQSHTQQLGTSRCSLLPAYNPSVSQTAGVH